MLTLKTLSTGSSGNCYLLSTENETLILDCGIPMKDIKKGLEYNITKVVGVAVSHSHQDHSRCVDDFKKMGIYVFTPYADSDVPEKSKMKYGSFYITAFKLPHNDTPNYGFLIEVDSRKILYMTDFEYCKYRFTNMNVDHILIECNYQSELVNRDLPNYEHKIKGHCSLETCKNFIEVNATNSLKTVLLLHMGGETCNPEECVAGIKKVAKNAYVDYARKGLEIELKKDLCPF